MQRREILALAQNVGADISLFDSGINFAESGNNSVKKLKKIFLKKC